MSEPSKHRKFGIWHYWSLFSTLQMRFKMWGGWVTEGFLPSKKIVNVFKTFMWDMRVYFTCPIQKLKCTFNTVYFDILCGQSLSGLSQMFQCVKEVPENMHRELTNSLKIVYVVMVFRGKLLKLWQVYFHQMKTTSSVYSFPLQNIRSKTLF